MDSVSDWQHPFVDIFKKYNTFDAPRSFKGSVNIIQVLIHLSRTPLLQENALNYRVLFYRTIQSPSLTLHQILNIAILLEDTYMFSKLRYMSNFSHFLKNYFVFISKLESKIDNLE